MLTLALEVRDKDHLSAWRHVKQVSGGPGLIDELHAEAIAMPVFRWRIKSATVGITLIERRGAL